MSPELFCFYGREDNPVEMKSRQLIFALLLLSGTILHMLSSISISSSLCGGKFYFMSKSEDITNISDDFGTLILSSAYDFFSIE